LQKQSQFEKQEKANKDRKRRIQRIRSEMEKLKASQLDRMHNINKALFSSLKMDDGSIYFGQTI
jgi:hypothetical protein